MLSLGNLATGYGKNIVVQNLSLGIERGKIIVLIGPNGSGKSTILKTIAKQIKKLGGTMSFCDRDWESFGAIESAKKVSVVTTERIRPNLMTCREIVEMGRFPYTNSLGILREEDKKIAEDAIRLVHAEDVAGRRFDQISDGQRQKVMLARAVAQDTDVVLLDEPTSFLDLYYKIELIKIIKRLALEKDKAVVMSLHELDLAKSVADFILCVDKGEAVKYGTPDEIFAGDFIQKLYGIGKDEFDSGTCTLRIGNQRAKDWSSGKAVPQGWSGSGTAESLAGREADECAQKKKTKVIMVQGTMSNAGKSFLVAGLCRVFKQDGFKAAPFKSQNMALNSFVTKDGLEMGRAQVMQAEAAEIEPEVCMNPILLKPTSDKGSQIIVNGKAVGNMDAAEYFKYKISLIEEIKKAFKKLEQKADIIVIEGAGSPAEINLRENDIVNMGLAELTGSNVLLVGDIDRGGVFAQLLGTLELLREDERARIKGLVINKFRGERSLLESGLKMLEERSGKKIAGVLPYIDVKIDDEDSLTERFGRSAEKARGNAIARIGVVRLPRISNFSDFSVFEAMHGVEVEYFERPGDIWRMDLVILPGSKNTIGDLRWLKESGMAEAVAEYAVQGILIGICGGYQILGRTVKDIDAVEEGGEESGLCLLDCETVLEKEKTTRQIKGRFGKIQGRLSALSGMEFCGYEIHAGRTVSVNTSTAGEEAVVSNSKGNVYGTYIHGIFDEGGIAEAVVQAACGGKTQFTENKLDFNAFKRAQYDMLADTVRKNLDMEAVYGMLNNAAI